MPDLRYNDFKLSSWHMHYFLIQHSKFKIFQYSVCLGGKYCGCKLSALEIILKDNLKSLD